MSFNGEYFQQIFGVIMGTNVAPILAKIYREKLELLLKETCKMNIKIKRPIFFNLKDLLMMVLESWKVTK